MTKDKITIILGILLIVTLILLGYYIDKEAKKKTYNQGIIDGQNAIYMIVRQTGNIPIQNELGGIQWVAVQDICVDWIRRSQNGF